MKPKIKAVLGTALLMAATACKEKTEPKAAEAADPAPQLHLVAETFSFTEGPATAANGDVYFTDQPNDRIYRWDGATGEIELFMEPAGRANGLYFDQEGYLLAAADEQFELWRIGPEKEVQVLASTYEGKHFNGPNDIWVHRDGTIYFTDPYYQRPYWTRKAKEIEQEQVYMIRPGSEEIVLAASDFVQPNGIIGTKDGSWLYIADIGDKKTYRYPIGPDGTLGERVLVAPMGSDGMTLDAEGNLYLTGDGVHVYSPEGELLRHIEVPEDWTANVTFGGREGNILFITAMDAVYTLKMDVKGMYP